jgi:cytosine deaminase
VLGGLDPVGIDGDRDGQLDLLFGLAERSGKPLDIHLRDGGETGLDQITEIARCTRALDLAGRVTISHAFCLADCAPDPLTRIAEILAEARIAVTTCALGADPVASFPQLTAAGVRVALGSDGVRDPWTPFGDGSIPDLAGYPRLQPGRECILGPEPRSGGVRCGSGVAIRWAASVLRCTA